MNGLLLPSAMPENPAAPLKPIAVIDIGTNTVLLLIAEMHADGSIHPLVYEQRIPRLGRGVDSRKHLSPEAMHRVIGVLNEYRSLMEQFPLASASVIGTSALRDAANREEFRARAEAETGFSVEVLSGADEAYWTYRGAISGIRGIQNAVVIDIGGGSTEVSSGSATAIASSVSIDIGSVRLTERYIRHDPPLQDEVRAVRETVATALAGLSAIPESPVTVVAVAGTATTLALLARQAREFSLKAVSGVTLTMQEIRTLTAELAQMSVSQILSHGSYLEGRADVITAGSLILEAVMGRLAAREVVVSERGVRYGIAIREWERGRGGERERGRR